AEDIPDIDFAQHAAALGAQSEKVEDLAGLAAALQRAKKSERTYVVVIDTDPVASTQAGGAWWDVPVAEVSGSDSVKQAARKYRKHLDDR
ncbi:MAG TPA: 3D-(3,5/4)-trihydroxycyclohexane-1,2-dione acylhydrolase (decyclizing), partial [Xanthomonadales bacterium]|nr:3D-(3,5/4)-trihydroxycyclohexane-1,2-dione acylhydrolase (decyclizing) [Xanthomonadales bacterium]